MKEKLDNLLQQGDVVLLRQTLEETPAAGLVWTPEIDLRTIIQNGNNDLAQLLIEKVTHVNVNQTLDNGLPLLANAINPMNLPTPQLVQALLARVDLDHNAHFNNTTLFAYAVEYLRLDVALQLLTHGPIDFTELVTSVLNANFVSTISLVIKSGDLGLLNTILAYPQVDAAFLNNNAANTVLFNTPQAVATALVDKGLSVNLDGIIQVNPQFAQTLVEHGVDVNQQVNGQKLFEYAIDHLGQTCPTFVGAILASDNLNHTQQNHTELFVYAITHGRVDVAQQLLNLAQVDLIQIPYMDNVITEVIKSGDLGLLNTILAYPQVDAAFLNNNAANTVLFNTPQAVATALVDKGLSVNLDGIIQVNPQFAQTLVEHGVDVNQQVSGQKLFEYAIDHLGQTCPTFVGAILASDNLNHTQQNHTELFDYAILHQRPDIAKQLLTLAPVDLIQAPYGNNVITEVINSGDLELVNKVLTYQQVDAQFLNQNVLHIVNAQTSTNIAVALVEHGLLVDHNDLVAIDQTNHDLAVLLGQIQNIDL